MSKTKGNNQHDWVSHQLVVYQVKWLMAFQHAMEAGRPVTVLADNERFPYPITYKGNQNAKNR